MKSYRNTLCGSLLVVASLTAASAQRSRQNTAVSVVSTNILLRIIRAEDERRWDDNLRALLTSEDAKVRKRAALAAGRIGDERTVPALVERLQKDTDNDVRQMAAFALGEIESPAGADALIAALSLDQRGPGEVHARAVEALGKIAAALPESEKDRKGAYGAAILDALKFEAGRRSMPDRLTILLGLTAALRAKPDGAGPVIKRFLGYSDPRIVADALNTLARLRLKDGNDEARRLLVKHGDPIVRANAARVLGATEDKEAFDALLDRALHDDDLRVRVSAIRALGNLKDVRAAGPLLRRASVLFLPYLAAKAKYRAAPDVRVSFERSVVRLRYRPPSKVKCCAHPWETNELLEIATMLSRVLPETGNKEALVWLRRFRAEELLLVPEIEIAMARISPSDYLKEDPFEGFENVLGTYGRLTGEWRKSSSLAQGLSEVAKSKSMGGKKPLAGPEETLRKLVTNESKTEIDKLIDLDDIARPDVLRAYVAFKPFDLSGILLRHLEHRDVIVRATAAELLKDLAPSEAITVALGDALKAELPKTEKGEMNDAALAILDALAKQKTAAANDAIKTALDASDHLIRRKAVALLKTNGVGDFSDRIDAVKTRNTEADYRRAIARIGKRVTATVVTSKGAFRIEFLPDEAPLTVDNFISLARKGFFNGQTIPRVVPNFVVQAGDPRGDQNGGPGYQIRCEINEVPYDRAAVGMALSGKDTGGSQWFVTHSPQPHLDGGYTVFGRVISGMEVVDNIARGDTIRRVTIIER
jgi:cyclophilin family peptidyl-prolyl cis-trans isomerase/HEAT repeat protein